ncbi:hypothetical protein DFH08DRAFT_1030773 [Mycena albidolilacea]|uniref:Uncharacterized protein n=1 Tax=Mycena albidolilacea TaxID=1033008 RepID=A0AAD7AJA3_9AGAR|nr:hypothetical protein DFH08DRAFT_1030773 [Mycena albidolilacea]
MALSSITNAWPDTPIPASTDNSNDTTILDTSSNSRSDEPMSNMTLYLTDTDTQMDSHPVFNDNTLQTDDTDPGFGFNFGLGSTTPTHSDTDVLQIMAAPVTLPSALVPGPAVPTPAATTPAVAGVGGNLLTRMTLLRAFGSAHDPSGRGVRHKNRQTAHKYCSPNNPSPPLYLSQNEAVQLLCALPLISRVPRRHRTSPVEPKKAVVRTSNPIGAGVKARGHGNSGRNVWRASARVGTAVMDNHPNMMHANPTHCPNPTVEGKVMGLAIKKWDWASPSPITLVYTRNGGETKEDEAKGECEGTPRAGAGLRPGHGGVGLEPVPVFDGSTAGTDGFGPSPHALHHALPWSRQSFASSAGHHVLSGGVFYEAQRHLDFNLLVRPSAYPAPVETDGTAGTQTAVFFDGRPVRRTGSSPTVAWLVIVEVDEGEDATALKPSVESCRYRSVHVLFWFRRTVFQAGTFVESPLCLRRSSDAVDVVGTRARDDCRAQPQSLL